MACKLSLLTSGLSLSPGPLHFKQKSPFFCPFPPKRLVKRKMEIGMHAQNQHSAALSTLLELTEVPLILTTL